MQRCSRRSILAVHSTVYPRGLAAYPARAFFRYVRQAEALSSTSKKTVPETQDSTFQPLSSSPFPDLRVRAQSVKKLSMCPVCTDHVDVAGNDTSRLKMVAFDCPDCGFPTHCSEEHWREDTEHRRYCSRLREINEDEHDLRSRRQKIEYELPGTLNFAI